MIIYLLKSELFTRDPDSRMARVYGIAPGVWTKVYQRYKLLELSLDEVRDLYTAKTGRQLSSKAIARWVWRSQIYEKTSPIIEKGVQTVMSDFFGKHEMEVVNELMKNIRFSDEKSSKSLL